LQNREKNDRHWIFRETVILPVFCDAHHLNARSIPHLVRASDWIGRESKKLTRKLPIHHGYTWRVLIVVPSKGSPGKQGSTGGLEVFGRDIEYRGVGCGVRWSQIGRIVGEDDRVALATHGKGNASVNPTDSTPGNASRASVIRFCIAGTRSPL